MSFRAILDTAKKGLGLAEREATRPGGRSENIRVTNPWHSVTIQAGPRRCKAAEALAGQRFLSKDAPTLPLKGCNEPACSCRYRHYDDRRHAGVPLDDNGVPLPHPHRRDND
jgi:hypothetical protein